MIESKLRSAKRLANSDLFDRMIKPSGDNIPACLELKPPPLKPSGYIRNELNFNAFLSIGKTLSSLLRL